MLQCKQYKDVPVSWVNYVKNAIAMTWWFAWLWAVLCSSTRQHSRSLQCDTCRLPAWERGVVVDEYEHSWSTRQQYETTIWQKLLSFWFQILGEQMIQVKNLWLLERLYATAYWLRKSVCVLCSTQQIRVTSVREIINAFVISLWYRVPKLRPYCVSLLVVTTLTLKFSFFG